MTVERLLQINVAVLAVLATVLLGLGQQNPYLPLVAFFAASVSLVFTDTFGWFRLNRGVANLFALVAAGYSLSSFVRFDKEQQLLSIANLLVYLQFILFFQQKTTRVYWQLMVLGLLQVVVAVALSLDAVSSVIIVAYMVAGLSAMTFFFLHRESLRVTGKLQRTVMTFRGLRTKSQKPEPATKPRAVFTANPQSLARELVGGRLFRQIAAMSLLSLLFATVLFYTVPRHGDSIWQGPGSRRNAKVGFSGMRGISFEEKGVIKESDEPVLRVAFRNHETGKHYPVVGRPYLRGTILVHYSARLKKWMQRAPRRRSSGVVLLTPPPSDAELVRQEVVLEPSDGQFLFSVFPWWQKEKDRDKRADRVAFDNVNEKLSVSRSSDNPTGTSYRYSVLTDAFRSGWQLRATPFLHDPYRLYSDGMSRRLHNYLTDMNYDTPSDQGREFLDLMRFPQLRQLVNRVIEATPDVDPANHLQVAKALEDHLRNSGEYRYSLDFRNLKRDPTLDPIEDFLVNHRTGHCEYYAGALALMLRSRNIPSRIVVGFVGGEFNPMGGFYQVRAKDAHAWVEAYIEPAHFEKDMLLPPRAEQTGVWYRLDPTPADSEEDTEFARTSPLMHKVDQFLDYFRFVWSDYIVGLDVERQQQDVFGNLPDQQSDALGGSHVRGWLDQAARTLGLASSDEAGKLRIRWPTVIVVLVGLVLFSYVARRMLRPSDKTKPKGVLRRLISRVVDLIAPAVFRPSHGKAHKRQHAEIYLEFYARLTRLVAPLGLVRQEGQTQQEFADKIRDQLLQLQQADSVASLPGKIVQVFYRVRFGGASLDTVEQENIEQDLSKLEQALSMNHD